MCIRDRLFNTRKTLRDIRAGNAAGVERTHGELGTRLADGLRGDDADRLALADRRTHRQIHAIAVRADTLARAAFEDRADLYAGDTGRADARAAAR